MNITNIVGTFKTATDSEMSMIQLYTDEAKAITKKEENIIINKNIKKTLNLVIKKKVKNS